MNRDQRAGLSLLLTALLCIVSFAGVACFDENLKQPRRLGKKAEGSSKRVSTGRGAPGGETAGASGEAGAGTTEAETTKAGAAGAAER